MKQIFLFTLITFSCFAQSTTIQNVYYRNTTFLNGPWQYVVDPYETGYYNYHSERRNDKDLDAYWMQPNDQIKTTE